VKVILTRDVPNLGQAGDVEDVAAGYARNYLIPKGLAVKATPSALRELRHRRTVETRRDERMATRAESIAQRLSDVTLSFEAKAGETGRLYGSITTTDIAEALERQVGEKFDRRKHILSDPIRQVGEHVIPVRLTADVTAEVKVVVKPEGGELPEPEPAPAEPAEEPAPADEQVPAQAEEQ
jgi:large subunit ribosomal protein L9